MSATAAKVNEDNVLVKRNQINNNNNSGKQKRPSLNDSRNNGDDKKPRGGIKLGQAQWTKIGDRKTIQKSVKRNTVPNKKKPVIKRRGGIKLKQKQRNYDDWLFVLDRCKNAGCDNFTEFYNSNITHGLKSSEKRNFNKRMNEYKKFGADYFVETRRIPYPEAEYELNLKIDKLLEEKKEEKNSRKVGWTWKQLREYVLNLPCVKKQYGTKFKAS